MTQPLYVYHHTHWDREWYLPFREYQHRLLKVVDDVLDAVESGALPNFTLDGQTVLLEDYLQFRPENQSRIAALVRSDRISIGPWYVMPDEFLVSGESLIRNLQRGIDISKSFGEQSFTGYLPDTFGHSADIPMILRHFGIETAIIWRGVRPRDPFFYWQSPSGGSVLTYHLTEGYFQNVFHMGRDFEEKSGFFQTWLSRVREVAPGETPVLFPIGADHLGIVTDAPQLMNQLAPQHKTVTPDLFMREAQSRNGRPLDTLTGELRDHKGPYILPGVYASRMYLKQWNRRLEWRLTRQLEQLLVWQALLGIENRYDSELDFMWKTLLLNHPHDSICGCSVDSVHRENENRFEQIDQLSQAILRDTHHALCRQLQPEGALLVMNLSDAPYTGVVEITQDYPLQSGDTSQVPNPPERSQVISEETVLDESFLLDTRVLPLSENKALRRRSLIWVKDVPPHGVQQLLQPDMCEDAVAVRENQLDNGLISMHVNPHGDLRVEEKKTGTVYDGLHQPWRNAEQGDSYNAAPVPGVPPEQARFLRAEVMKRGPLRGTLKLHYVFDQIDLHLFTEVSLDAGSRRVDFVTRFTNNTPDHKIQIRFNTPRPLTEVVAEGHFSPITRTYDPAYRIEDHMPAPPQKELLVQNGPIQRFVGFADQTLITEGLTEYEVEGQTLKLTLMRGFALLSSDRTGVRGSHAGPPLPTPEGQCLNRRFECRYAWLPRFDMATAFHQADRFYGAVYGFDRHGSPQGPTEPLGRSFFTWDNREVQATAMVPVQDGWQLRLLNPTGQPQTVRLTLSGKGSAIRMMSLDGRVMENMNESVTTVPPFQLQTFQLAVE